MRSPRNKKNHKKIIITLVVLIIIIYLFHPTWTPAIHKSANSISSLEQVNINGSNHEIMIRGTDKDNPILLFVHGGPACPEIPYVRKYQDLLEQNFTVVQYDQRGCGKSYHLTEDYSDLSIDLLVQDLLSVTDYLSKTIPDSEILLVGHSFGTGIAIRAAYTSPELYLAYIGIGQQSDYWDSDLAALEYCLSKATSSDHNEDARLIESYRNGVIYQTTEFPTSWVRKYGGAAREINETSDTLQGTFLSTEYNAYDGLRFLLGLKCTGDILWEDMLRRDLPFEVPSLSIPCYFVSGVYDYLTPSSTAQEYLDSLEAPYKEFVTFEHSAHYPQFEEKEAFHTWICDTYNKLHGGLPTKY